MQADGGTYQKDDGNVQQECNASIRNQREHAEIGDALKRHLGHLHEEPNGKIHAGTGRSKVVERDERIHLELAAAKQTLDHGETSSFTEDACHLEDEAHQDELDLADGCDHDAQDDDGNVGQGFEVGRLHAKGPCDEKDNDGGGGLDVPSATCM